MDTQTRYSSFRSIFTCMWSAHGLENSIHRKCDKCRQIIRGSLTRVEVLHFMSMTCQVELSAVNAVNQYSWQLLLRLLLNNGPLTPPIWLTFTSSDTHTLDWRVQTTHTQSVLDTLSLTHKCGLYVNAELLC